MPAFKDYYNVCIVCGDKFTTRYKNNRFCCDKCSVIFYTRKKEKRKKEKIICTECGKEFESSNGNRKFCNIKCTNIYHKKHRRISYFTIFERDNFQCVYCGKSSLEDNVKLVIDHIEPRKNGVNNNVFNLATACEQCNAYKSSSILSVDILERIKNIVKSRTEKHSLEYTNTERMLSKHYKNKD